MPIVRPSSASLWFDAIALECRRPATRIAFCPVRISPLICSGFFIIMRVSNKIAFAGLAVASLGLLGSGLAIGELNRLQPCYWCNFQRLLYITLATIGLCGVLLSGWARLWGFLAGVVAMAGVLAAGKQSWMQFAPQDAIECGFGDPTLIEQLVDWLGGLWPSMFMVTGLCKEKDWVFLGLSLANWSGVCFLGLCFLSLWLFTRSNGRE